MLLMAMIVESQEIHAGEKHLQMTLITLQGSTKTKSMWTGLVAKGEGGALQAIAPPMGSFVFAVFSLYGY